jgi:rod shape-determining protein MreC
MFRRQHYWIFGGVVLLALVFISLPERAANRFKLAINGLFIPLFALTQSADRATEKAGNVVIPRSDLIRENEQLRQENRELKLQLRQTEEVWRENQELRRQLAWRSQSRWKARLARVTGRDPANWWRTLHINVGEQDGIKANYPVVTPEGLVGRILEVGPNRSQVVLLGDSKCRVSALVPEARDSGVVTPSAAASWKNQFVELGYLSRTGELKPGQSVITSGMGGIFPPGIAIGQIVDLRSVDGLYVEARVKLAVNFSQLEVVWVLIP